MTTLIARSNPKYLLEDDCGNHGSEWRLRSCGNEGRLMYPERERKCSVNGHPKLLLISPELIQIHEGFWMGLLRGCLLSFGYKILKAQVWKQERKAQSALYRASDAALS